MEGEDLSALEDGGKIPMLKEILASLERMGDRMGEYFLVGKWEEDQ